MTVYGGGETRGLESRILDALRGSPRGPLKAKELARELSVPTAEYRRFKRSLLSLLASGKVYRVRGQRYAAPDRVGLVAGRLDVTRAGDAFVRPDGGGGDVFVPASQVGTAMDEDRVVVRIEGRPRGRSPIGRVIKVLERAHHTVVGTLHRNRRIHYVVPLDRRLRHDVLVPPGDENDAAEGDVVVVEIESFEAGPRGPVGKVTRVLGRLADPGVDILSVAYEYGLSMEFPAEVLREAEEAAAVAPHADSGRVDRTDLTVFTIDPSDAKDHDDALSVESAGDGAWEVGIHIADVSRFVKEDSPLDVEALARGTSVYLVDRAIPMLPEALSGDACSLRAGVDRAAVSVFITLDRAARVHGCRFQRTLVRSRRRLTYEEVQEALDGTTTLGDGLDDALRRLDDLARLVRAGREARGALDLDLPEARVLLDRDGIPLDIRREPRLESHRLVEDFMILANEVVAREGERRGLPLLYRIHEPPEGERMDDLRALLARLGHGLPRGKVRPVHLQALLTHVRGRPEEALVSNVVLRSLKRAVYAPDNLGHFGLASEAYVHFTSPIRRYPDLMVHREVVRSLVDGSPPREWDPVALEFLADRCSERERAADDAERDSIALKKVEFMERHLGDEFDGRISGVASFGFFVTLERYFVDGLVHVSSLDDDYYRFQERAYALVGERGRRRFSLGDRVRVQVVRVDKAARHVDFLLVRTLPRGV